MKKGQIIEGTVF